MACGTMQLRFFKLGTVLTYAFKGQNVCICDPASQDHQIVATYGF